MTYRFASLADVSFTRIHECFVQAFSDYAVNVAEVSEEGLLRRAHKNGWVPELSVGARLNGSLVAITLIGLDEVAGEKRAYDIATGIVFRHRGKGLAGKLLETIIPELHARKLSALHLEVLQNNRAGIRAYEKAGFSRVRALHSLEARAGSVPAPIPSAKIVPIDAGQLRRLSANLEFEPSYEQRDSAIEFLSEYLLLLGAFDGETCVGGIAYDTETNWLMRLVTHRKHRRKGVARTLVGSLARTLLADTRIKAVNVDENDAATFGVLRKCGFRDSVRQWEMRLSLCGAKGDPLTPGRKS